MEQRRYETLVLLSPDLSSEELDQLKTKFTDIIDQLQGRLIRLDDWGRRQLAYQVKKQLYGYYYLMDFMGTPSLLAEMERQMRLDERVFKFL
ncbi:MAG: 30S ribosomal protein S6, partial [Thermodesulfobacteriota bacterium]|nr:30S ribosomal protein S6 [Thermodesulfobacteriota bacterium]